MDLALALHQPLDDVVGSTSSTQFLDWRVKLDRKRREVTPEQWLLAQVSAELHNLAVTVRGLTSKNPGKFVNIEQCLPKWTGDEDKVSNVEIAHGPAAEVPEPEAEVITPDPELVKIEAAKAKALWSARLGLPPEFFKDGG